MMGSTNPTNSPQPRSPPGRAHQASGDDSSSAVGSPFSVTSQAETSVMYVGDVEGSVAQPETDGETKSGSEEEFLEEDDTFDQDSLPATAHSLASRSFTTNHSKTTHITHPSTNSAYDDTDDESTEIHFLHVDDDSDYSSVHHNNLKQQAFMANAISTNRRQREEEEEAMRNLLLSGDLNGAAEDDAHSASNGNDTDDNSINSRGGDGKNTNIRAIYFTPTQAAAARAAAYQASTTSTTTTPMRNENGKRTAAAAQISPAPSAPTSPGSSSGASSQTGSSFHEEEEVTADSEIESPPHQRRFPKNPYLVDNNRQGHNNYDNVALLPLMAPYSPCVPRELADKQRMPPQQLLTDEETGLSAAVSSPYVSSPDPRIHHHLKNLTPMTDQDSTTAMSETLLSGNSVIVGSFVTDPLGGAGGDNISCGVTLESLDDDPARFVAAMIPPTSIPRGDDDTSDMIRSKKKRQRRCWGRVLAVQCCLVIILLLILLIVALGAGWLGDKDSNSSGNSAAAATSVSSQSATSHNPTIAPTPTPTASPSLRPTASPTSKPTTNSPTGSPMTLPPVTAYPTFAGNTETTEQPSVPPSPTASTGSPSTAPTTMSPTKSPFAKPTSSPSNAPSRAPSQTPTSRPSSSPTPEPTRPPTTTPSAAPSPSPSSASPTPECHDDPDVKFLVLDKRQSCRWLARQDPGFILLVCDDQLLAHEHCRVTCQSCGD